MPQRNYFVVYNEDGKLLVINGQLPIYWAKAPALRIANNFGGSVQPVPVEGLEKLILSKPNKNKR